MLSPDCHGPDLSEEELRRARTLLPLGHCPDTEQPLGPGVRFGDYEIVETIGDGATCFVYRARHAGRHRTVALKVMTNLEAASDMDLRRFRNGAAAAAALDHPHIVPVFHVGERDGRPFFTMPLLKGGALSRSLGRFHESPERAARLIAKVARAIGYAHAHHTLHRDLKPANILLDEQDEPYVADFGLAKRLDRTSLTEGAPGLMGTLLYMSPEQARAERAERASDIFSLGVIFFELLTGRAPYEGLEAAPLIAALTSPTPVPSPRTVRPDIGRSFENICMRCLEKDGAKRYRSAEDLAADLERACGGRVIPSPVTPIVRAARWARRHRRLSIAFGALASIAVAMAVLWRAGRIQELRELETNAFIATGQAGAALFQLREYADRVQQFSREPAIRALLDHQSVPRTPAELRSRLGDFNSLFVLGVDGRIRAQWPAPADHVWQRDYSFRDYFKGARDLAQRGRDSVFVAPAFRSESHGWLQFALSAPVRDDHGGELGVLVGTLNASTAFGAVRMTDADQSARITTSLLGPRGVDRQDASRSDGQPARLSFVVHPALGMGAEHPLVEPRPAVLRAAFGPAARPGEQFAMRFVPPYKQAGFQDPFEPTGGDSLAAFAPVGNTGFVVLVQTHAQGLLHQARLLSAWARAHRGVVLGSLAGCLMVAAAAVAARNRWRRVSSRA